jgi:hypothetical protein
MTEEANNSSTYDAKLEEATTALQRRVVVAEKAAREQSEYSATVRAAYEDWVTKRVTPAQVQLRNWEKHVPWTSLPPRGEEDRGGLGA